MRLPAQVVALREWAKLVTLAGGLGHHLGEPEQDTEVSLVAECGRCEILFAVDGCEKPYQHSAGLSIRCSPVVISARG